MEQNYKMEKSIQTKQGQSLSPRRERMGDSTQTDTSRALLLSLSPSETTTPRQRRCSPPQRRRERDPPTFHWPSSGRRKQNKNRVRKVAPRGSAKEQAPSTSTIN